jgi:hypothetical protein
MRLKSPTPPPTASATDIIFGVLPKWLPVEASGDEFPYSSASIYTDGLQKGISK